MSGSIHPVAQADAYAARDRETAREDRVASSVSTWARVARRAWTGTRLGVGAALGLWVGDALVLLLGRGEVTWTQWGTGVGAALLVAWTSAVAIGGLLGPLLLPVGGRVAATARLWWRGLHEPGAGAGRALAAHLAAMLLIASVGGALACSAVSAILFGVARATTTEVALSISHLIFATMLVVAWRPALRASRFLVDLVARAPGIRWLLARASWVAGCFGALVVVALGTLAVAVRHELATLPWSRGAPFVLVVPGAMLGLGLPRRALRWRPGLVRAALAVVAMVFVASVVAGLRLRPESTTAQVMAFERAWSGRGGYAVWTLVLDFDRDGQLGVLGGGDCAPFDPRRHGGAPEIPGNGIDEDCDGEDLPALALLPRPRPASVPTSLPVRPDIVFVTVDALAAPRLKALGGVSHMPRLDAFAESSRLFSHCFSQGPSTRLSFPSMFTSHWDSEIVFTYAPRLPYSLAPAEKQLQDLVDDAGYDSVAVLPQEYFGKSSWPSITRNFQRVDETALPHGKHNAPQVTDAALRALSGQHDRPLYLWVHYYDAHPPYLPLPGAGDTDRSDEPLYDAELGFIDRELGRLFDAIAQRPDPTYVVLTADHATVFHPNPESRSFHYGYDLYTATLHVPLIIHGPGIAPGRVDDIVSTMDVAPTILDLIRSGPLPDAAGTSLLPELVSARRDPGRVLFHEFYLPEFILRGRDPLQMVSVRDARLNLVLNRERGRYELYDWTADYFEQHDLFESAGRTQEVRRLASLLGSFVAQFDGRAGTDALIPEKAAL